MPQRLLANEMHDGHTEGQGSIGPVRRGTYGPFLLRSECSKSSHCATPDSIFPTLRAPKFLKRKVERKNDDSSCGP